MPEHRRRVAAAIALALSCTFVLLACRPQLDPASAAAGGQSALRSVSIEPASRQRGVRVGEEVRARLRAVPGTAVPELRYSWRVGDAPFAPGGSRFEIPETAGRKRVWLRVEIEGGEALESSVVVANTPPLVEALVLEPPDTLRSGQRLRAVAVTADRDGDELWLDYTWIVNGRRLRDRGPELAAERLAVGDRVEVEVQARDGVDRSAPLRAGPVVRENAEPVFISDPPKPSPGAAFAYRIRGMDPDGSRGLYYRVLAGPTGITLDPLTGRLHWEPSLTPEGRHVVVLAIEDPDGGRATQRFAVEVPDPALDGSLARAQ